jgi:hypothetical protein
MDLARVTVRGEVGVGLLRGDGWVVLADEADAGTDVETDGATTAPELPKPLWPRELP